MRFFLVVIFFCIQIQAQDYYVYVAAESDDTVSLIKFNETETKEVDRFEVGYLPTEIEGPHGITVDPNGKFWYLSLAHGNPFGKLIKYSTKNNKPIDQTTLGLFPASMQISSVTGLLYCVNFNLHGDMKPSSVSVVDPETMTEIKRIKIGTMPHGSRLSYDGLKQYSVSMMSSELYEIDAISLKVSRKLSLDNKMSMDASMNKKMKMDESMKKKMKMNGMSHSKVKPTWVIPHPSKNIAYVAGNGSNEIIEVDLKNWKITNRISTGKGPYNVEISPDGKFLVATLKSEGTTAIWDLKNDFKSKIIKNTTSVTHGIAISSDSKYAFVSVEGIGGEPGVVDVISLKKLEKISSVNIGKQAGGIAFWKIEN
ncbi:MAG: YncE family protein [Flavobacteriaceae bacterium]|nr:YncE family protein [Flavobacteriaceae bacterium]